MKGFDEKQKKEIIAKIEASKGELGIIAAAKKAGVSDKTYYTWIKTKKKKPKKKKHTKPFLNEIAIPHESSQGKIFCVFADISQIAQLIKEL